MKIQTTIVYQKTEQAYKQGFPTIIHQGGTRSSKTYNILIWLIVHALSDWHGKVIDVTRDTMVSLRSSAMFDFFKILEDNNLYDVEKHNKTESIYRIGTNIFRFFGADDDQKVRGPGRDILFCNEMNGMSYKAYKQLNQRTKELTIGDYNPSDEFHWIYDHILPQKQTAFFVTTFRDNPFLPPRIIKQIRDYKKTDPNYWRIYGLGERGVAEATIYSNWESTKKKWDEMEGQEFFGLDFGYNDPTAMVRIKYHKKGIYVEQLLYKTQLTSDRIVKELEKLRKQGKLTYDSEIYADCARPEIITAIADADFNIHSVKKGADSILRGIDFIKKHRCYIPEESLDLIREMKSYKWKVDRDERVIDVPVDLNDHLCDATRYALETLSREDGRMGVLSGSGDVFGGDL